MPDDLDLIAALEKNVARCIVGKPDVVRLAVIGLLARGHLLIEDVPGVGKTTLAAALARSIGGRFARIQFTADMLPSDVIGVSVWDGARGEFSFKQGPLFANVVLADEINRTTPKTQSSLLEAMNEAQVSLDQATHALPSPFMVLATQNPREYEGTFPLPESQLDRFLLRVRIGYPDAEDEKAILRGAAATADALAPALALDDVRRLQTLADTVRVADLVLDYVMALVAATREPARLALGVSTRGARALVAAARAAALTEGRDYVLPDDVKRLAVPALAHRVIARSAAAVGGHDGVVDTEAIVRAIVQDVAVPR
ncbi:MAG: AAA family ATPase [Candidatus Rokubacteria bacterium]|nr:AAA family ATPase [Candidatus Rokubacteria bacterium]